MNLNLVIAAVVLGALATPANARQTSETAYESLTDLPASVAVRLACPKRFGSECPTRVRLKREAVVWGVPLKAGTVASDWEEDRYGILARDVLFKGVWLKGGTRVRFYTTWGGTLQRDQVINGVACRGGSEVAFDNESNRLVEYTLTADQTIGGCAYVAGLSLQFDADGRVIRVDRGR